MFECGPSILLLRTGDVVNGLEEALGVGVDFWGLGKLAAA
jgi:hypothetical protein